MRKLLFALPVLLAALLALLFWSRDDRVRHSERGPRGDPLTAERLAEIADEGVLDARSELDEPVALTGRVYDPNGRPVRAAEVMVRWPRTWTMAYTNTDGSYELTFKKPGRYLVEAQLGLDLAPSREIVVVPETGGPAPQDFHLKPTGHVFGEVVAGGAPVFSGWADIGVVDRFGDVTWELDTDVDNGFFNFFWEPPRHITLRLVIRSQFAFMESPVEFKFTGERLDLGRVVLKRYPTVLLRMRRPDGTYAPVVEAGYASDMTAEDGFPSELLTEDSHLVLRSRENVTGRFVFLDPGEGYRVIRDVELVYDQLQELELDVRPGPIVARRRLLDEHGDPIRARIAFDEGRPVETGRDGFFSVAVPNGGLHTLRLTAIHAPDLGWVPLPTSPNWERTPFFLDADAPAEDCVVRLDRRVLVIQVAPAGMFFAAAGKASTDDLPAAWRVLGNGVQPGLFGALSPRMRPGTYQWFRLQRVRTARGLDWADAGDGIEFEVAKRGLTIVDAR